jgi:hypothetical protein
MVFGHFYPADSGAGEEQANAVIMVSLSKMPLIYLVMSFRCAIVFGDTILNIKLYGLCPL